MWTVLAGPLLAGAVLLVVAGVPKVADPLPLVNALRSVGLLLPGGRASAALGRLLALAEIVVGLLAILLPGMLSAALVALAYVGFTGFVALALRRGGVLASCGCFGKADTPPTRTHLVLTGALALAATGVAVSPPPPRVWSTIAPDLVATTGLYAVVLAFLSYLVIAVLPLASARAQVVPRALLRPSQDG